MADTKFRFSHLWPAVVLLICVVLQIVFFSHSVGIILSLLAFAYVQSIAFGLTSRSRNRSSSTYHFIAVMLSTLIFFWMLRRLITNELTLTLLLPYIAGTVSGSITGAQISTWIEKKIGAIADIANGPPIRERSFFVQAWPIFVLSTVLIFQLSLQPLHLVGVFAALAVLLFADNFSHTLTSRAGNRNKPMFILGSSLLNGAVKFLIYQRLVAYNMGWDLFIPYATGGVSGSISGALTSMRIEKRIGASPDAHLRASEAPKFVLWPIGVLFIFVLIEVLFFRGIALPIMTLFGLALAQNFSFMVVSRARNRNNVLYHGLASIFSNGVWFVTFRELYLAGLEWPFFLPFIAGVAAGSLIAFNISTIIERRIKAVADTS